MSIVSATDGLLDLDRLEAALEGGVLLEVLAVLVEGGRADGLQLATGQHRLEDGGGVDGAFRRAGTDERVDLVDEQHDVATGADLLEHLLQALLEVTAVAAPGDQGTEVEGVELLAGQGLGDLVGHDPLGQPLDDGRLAHARLADQHGVVLGAAGQDLHDPLDLLLTTDDRVELAVPCQLREIAAELVENRRSRRVVARRGTLARTDRLLALIARHELDHLLAHAAEVGAEADQNGGGDAFALAHQTEQHVLGTDVAVAQLQGLAQRELENLLRRGVKGGEPLGAVPAMPIVSSTFSRTASREIPRDSRALAATPSPSWMRPSRMCSVPIKLWFRRRASSCANTNTLRARSVKRSNTVTASLSNSYFSVPAGPCPIGGRSFVGIILGTQWGPG